MWAISATLALTPTPPIKYTMISIPNLPPPPANFAAAPDTANARRRLHQSSATSDGVGGPGRAVFTSAVVSDPRIIEQSGSNPRQGKKKGGEKQKESEKKVEEMSGSDILSALQKASARKAQIKKQQQQLKRNLKRRVDPNTNLNVDYDKIRPVTIKSDWTTRLDDLQRRLQDFLSF